MTSRRRIPRPVPPRVPEVSRSQYEAADVLGYLLAGPLTFGGAGWFLDEWLHTTFFLPIGVLLGVGLALYVVWFRYGRV